MFKVGKAEVHGAEYFGSFGRSFRLFPDHRLEVRVDADSGHDSAEHDDVLVFAEGLQLLVYKITHDLTFLGIALWTEQLFQAWL